MALSDEQIVLTARPIGGLFDDLAVHYQSDDIVRFGRAIEAEARRDALEEAAQVCESIARDDYGLTKWHEYGECAAAIRKLKEDIQ